MNLAAIREHAERTSRDRARFGSFLYYRSIGRPFPLPFAFRADAEYWLGRPNR